MRGRWISGLLCMALLSSAALAAGSIEAAPRATLPNGRGSGAASGAQRPAQAGLPHLWPFKPPKPRVQDSGLDITIPPELRAQLQKAMDRMSEVVYWAGVRDCFTVLLVTELALAAIILLCMRVQVNGSRAAALTILTAIVLWYASQAPQATPGADRSAAAPVKQQQYFGVSGRGGHP